MTEGFSAACAESVFTRVFDAPKARALARRAHDAPRTGEPGSLVAGAGVYTAGRAITRPRQEPHAGKPRVRMWAEGAR
jgi:hypothetical protein